MELKDFIKKEGTDTVFSEFSKEQVHEIKKIKAIKDKVIYILKNIYDPEISLNIWDLGLIYDVSFDEEIGIVNIKMTLTSPTCPVADLIPKEVESKIRFFTNLNEVNVKLLWEPKWDRSMISEEGRFVLDL